MTIYEPLITYVKREVEGVILNKAEETYNFAYKFMEQNSQNPTVEHLILICLNRRNRVVITKILTIGTENKTLFRPADIIKQVLLNNCSNFVVLHTHPSGIPEPSAADNRATRMLREACQVMDINFADHIIMGERNNDPMGLGYYSFREAGVINMSDVDKINSNLIKLTKLKYNPYPSDYQLGIANMAELLLSLNTRHANSFEYKDAMIQLNEMARNAEKLIK